MSVAEDLARAGEEIGAAIVAVVMPRWSSQLSQSEVVLAGGNAKHIERAVRAALDGQTLVTMLDRAIYRVAEGLERLLRHKLQAVAK
jgi:DNA-binding transcriptional regulator YdaS (Cro superfamily)